MFVLNDAEKNRVNLTVLLQHPIAKSEGKLSNLKSFLNLSLPDILEKDIKNLKQHYDNFDTAKEKWTLLDDDNADTAEIERCFNTLKSYIKHNNTPLRSKWLKFSAQLMLKNSESREELENIEAQKELIEPWLQLLLLSTSILDLILGVTFFIAPELTPVMAGIYLLISAISLICQIAMLNQLFTTMFSYKPLRNEQAILSESIHIINDAFNFSEQEKEKALKALTMEKKAAAQAPTPFSFFNTDTWFTHPEERPLSLSHAL
ncbi:MAG: hypothetical protein P1U61_06945 [Legionellaceae bacterium]|nr:hypothetical protein [Legionellaceae bacterium]